MLRKGRQGRWGAGNKQLGAAGVGWAWAADGEDSKWEPLMAWLGTAASRKEGGE